MKFENLGKKIMKYLILIYFEKNLEFVCYKFAQNLELK